MKTKHLIKTKGVPCWDRRFQTVTKKQRAFCFCFCCVALFLLEKNTQKQENHVSIQKQSGHTFRPGLDCSRKSQAKKSAEAVKISADADAYAIKVKAEADAEQTRVVGQAIKDDGQPAINFEIMKRQVDGLSELASSDQTKTLVVPSDITKALGSLELLLGTFSKDKDK